MPETLHQNVMRRAKAQVKFSQEPKAGAELYGAVRAALLLNGETLQQWCNREEVDRGWAYQALMGTTEGEAARELRRKLVAYAGLTGAR